MIISLRIVAILSLLEVCRAYTAAANNPPMLTHASMDVGNIISIVIPESPDENINVEQLTGEFRQQLERIKKQSRASKVEHGLVTLKRVLPEMSREEKRKTLPLIRRILHGRRVANSGSMKNWTREAQRLEHINEAGQLVRSHSAGKPEERKIFRDYGEPVNPEGITTRTVQSVGDKDEYRRVNEEVNADRREEGPREDTIRRNNQIRQEQLIHYDEQSHRDDRANVPDEDQSLSKIARSGGPQEWNNQNWEDLSGDPRNYPETTTDYNYKSDRTVLQKEPGNEILQNDRYEKLGRISELEQQMTSRYPVSRQDGTDNTKRYVKDGREYRLTDIAGFINYARENDMNDASNPDCDNMKRNSSGQYMEYEGNRDVVFDKQPLEAMNFARESFRGLQKIIQDPRGHFDRSNASGLDNLVSESVGDYPSKKKRGQRYTNDFRRFSSIKSSPGNNGMERWNIPNYDNRHTVNSSDDIRAAASVYKMLAQKEINSAVGYMQTEQGNFQQNFENEPKIAASQHFGNYHGDSRILRTRRALNPGYESNQKHGTPESSSNVNQTSREDSGHHINETLLERLNRILKTAQTPKFIVLYANGSVDHNEKSHKAFTVAAKSQSTVSSSIIEPTPLTSHGVSMVMKSTTYLPQIPSTDDRRIKPIGKSRAL